MIVTRYVSDTKEIFEASESNFQHARTAAYKLPERFLFPPALAGNDLSEGKLQVLNVHRIEKIDSHTAKCDLDSASEIICSTTSWYDWHGDLDYTNASKDD